MLHTSVIGKGDKAAQGMTGGGGGRRACGSCVPVGRGRVRRSKRLASGGGRGADVGIAKYIKWMRVCRGYAGGMQVMCNWCEEMVF